MTTLTQSRTTGFATSLFLFTLKPLIAHFQRRKTLAQLSELDDHLLKDIGMNRFDVTVMRRLF